MIRQPRKPRILIECPRCALGAEVAADCAGKQATCRRFGARFVVRSLAPEPEDGDPPRGGPICADESYEVSGGDGRWSAELPGGGLIDRLSEPAKMAFGDLGEFRELHLRRDADTRYLTTSGRRERDTWYDLRGPLGTVATVIGRRDSFWGQLARGVGCDQERRLWLIDRYRTRALLELKATAWSAEVTIPAVGQVGRIERSLQPLVRKYELRDAAGEVFAYLRSPIWKLRMSFQVQAPAGGEPVGGIRQRLTGWGREYFTDLDDFVIEFGRRPWTLEERSVLIAAAIVIDLEAYDARLRATLPG